ncbi:MAG: hypothetical protein RL660_1804 [Bacteroidota bacterium]
MRNSLIYGIITSLAATAFGLAFVYVVKAQPNNISFSTYVDSILRIPSFRSGMLTLALLGNIPLLYFFQRRKMMQAAYGVCIPLITIGLIVVASKLHFI